MPGPRHVAVHLNEWIGVNEEYLGLALAQRELKCPLAVPPRVSRAQPHIQLKGHQLLGQWRICLRHSQRSPSRQYSNGTSGVGTVKASRLGSISQRRATPRAAGCKSNRDLPPGTSLALKVRSRHNRDSYQNVGVGRQPSVIDSGCLYCRRCPHQQHCSEVGRQRQHTRARHARGHP